MAPWDLLSIVWRFAKLSSSQYWDADKIEAYQGRKLVSMLCHAVAHVTFYRELGIDASSIRSPADLERFPLLTKQQVQERPEDFIADNFKGTPLHSSLAVSRGPRRSAYRSAVTRGRATPLALHVEHGDRVASRYFQVSTGAAATRLLVGQLRQQARVLGARVTAGVVGEAKDRGRR